MSKQQRKAKKQKARAKAARVKAWRSYRAKSCGGRIFQQFVPALYECVPAEAVVIYGLETLNKIRKKEVIALLEARIERQIKALHNKMLKDDLSE